MGLLDRPVLSRLAESAEEYLGIGLRSSTELDRLAVVEHEYSVLAGEAEELGMHVMDFFGGRPSELSPERRKRIAQRSRIALKFDPLAGAEAGLLGDFSFGKGVPIPTARDRRVQAVIDEAWTDAKNEEVLTGYMAQRKLSNELLTTGELFITLYVAGGRVRVGRLDPDTVEAVVPDPEDRLRPLWYLTHRRKHKWNYETDSAEVTDSYMQDGRPAVRYWKHWRNYDDAVFEREQGVIEDDEAPIEPPASKIAKGVVFHLAINQTGEESRGNPPWARSLRFFSAMNTLTESHVAMAQAASTFIARRQISGGTRQVTRAAAGVLNHVSELGAGRFPAGGRAGDQPAAFAPGAGRPPAPGSWWTENLASRLEALDLKSGSGQMQQTAQIVRAPISAASGFGQHYLGDASTTNLATASTLELPSTMRIESWQEYFAQIYRWFTDRAIEAAVKAGKFGGLEGFPDAKPLGEMRLHEAEDRDAMERRTATDLSYDFVMPFPGRRALPDVHGFVVAMMDSYDPNGVNIPLRRQFLRFAMEQMSVPDVGRAVEEAIPEEGIEGGIGGDGFNPPAPIVLDPNALPGGPGAPVPGSTPRGREALPGVRRRASEPTQEAYYLPEELRPAMDEFEREDAERFRQLVTIPTVEALLALSAREPAAASANGSGG